MPIRPDLRKYYGPEWRKFRKRLIADHDYRCSDCGERTPYWLNLTHDLHDPRLPGVRLRCPSCHAKYDAKQNYALARRTRAKRVGQLWLFTDVEFAPIPLADIPPEIRAKIERESRGNLFR